MSKKLEEIVQGIKNTLKNSITKESSKEQIEFASNMDKNLDLILEEDKKQDNEITGLKDKLVEVVKGTSFKMKNDEDDDPVEGDTKSLDDILKEKLNEIEDKKGK